MFYKKTFREINKSFTKLLTATVGEFVDEALSSFTFRASNYTNYSVLGWQDFSKFTHVQCPSKQSVGGSTTYLKWLY